FDSSEFHFAGYAVYRALARARFLSILPVVIRRSYRGWNQYFQPTIRGEAYEGDGYRKGDEGLGSRGDAEQRAGYGNGELQRRTGKSRHHAGRRWTKAIVAGQTAQVLGKQTDGYRRTVRRDQGTHRRLLDLAGSVHGRGR